MEKRKYIFVKDEKGKRHRLQIIEGDPITREELIEQLNRQRISDLKFQMEKIRTNDALDEMQKSSRRSEIAWRLEKLKREMER